MPRTGRGTVSFSRSIEAFRRRRPDGSLARPARDACGSGRLRSGLLAGRTVDRVCGPVFRHAAPQILVKPAEGSGGKIQITSEWGTFPVWTDREIIYLANNQKVVAVEARTSPTFHAGAPRELFDLTFDRGSGPLREYDVTRDGETFVFVGGATRTGLEAGRRRRELGGRAGPPGAGGEEVKRQPAVTGRASPSAGTSSRRSRRRAPGRPPRARRRCPSAS